MATLYDEFFFHDLPKGWEPLFKECQPELHFLAEFLTELEKTGPAIFPPKKDIFRAFHLTPYSEVKVVIIGQDPYPTKGQAMGLSFSVPREKAIPASLRTIFKELEMEYPGFKTPENGDLTPWAKQGVLLLNACLTVPEGTPGGHGRIWDGFISKTLQLLSKLPQHVVYILWGRDAQKWEFKIGDEPILEGLHPAARPTKGKKQPPFLGCGHFLAANKLLVDQGLTPIKWTDL